METSNPRWCRMEGHQSSGMAAVPRVGGHGLPEWKHQPEHLQAGAALRSRPKCGPSGPAIFGFVVRFGGSSKLLADTQAYVRACGKGGRELGQETWATLSQEMKNFPDHLRWRHALLKYGFAGDTTLTVTDAARKQFISVRTHTCIIYISIVIAVNLPAGWACCSLALFG